MSLIIGTARACVALGTISVGAAIIAPPGQKMRVFSIATIAALALQGVAYFFGAQACVGAIIGGCLGMSLMMQETGCVGGAFMGAGIGFFLSNLFPAAV